MREKYTLTRYYKDLEPVSDLIKEKGSVDIPDENGYTPLAWAVWNDDIEMVEELLKAGADINHISNHGTTALMIAVKWNYLELAEYLLQKGADINIGPTKEDIFSYKMPAAPLILACQESCLEMIQLLLKFNPIIDIEDTFNCTPLFYAIERLNITLIELLLSKGAKLNNDILVKAKISSTGESACKIVEFLINKGADINAKDELGNTALIYATYGSDNIDMIECLLSLGADKEIKNNNGVTALMVAMVQEDEEAMELLEERI